MRKLTENEIRENSVWLRLVRTNKLRGEDRVNGQSIQANLENVRRQTRMGMRLAKHTVTDFLSRTCISAHSTDDVTRQNDRDKGKANRAGTKRVIRWSLVERGLLNHALGDTPSLASTSASSADCFTRQIVKGDKVKNGHCCEHKDYMWVMLTSVFKLTSRMQAVIHMLVSAYIPW